MACRTQLFTDEERVAITVAVEMMILRLMPDGESRKLTSEIDAKTIERDILTPVDEYTPYSFSYDKDARIPIDRDVYDGVISDPLVQDYLDELRRMSDELSVTKFRDVAESTYKKRAVYRERVDRDASSLKTPSPHESFGSAMDRLLYSAMWKCMMPNVPFQSLHYIRYHIPPQGSYDDMVRIIMTSIVDDVIDILISMTSRISTVGGYPVVWYVSKRYTTIGGYGTGSLDVTFATVDGGLDALMERLSAVKLPTKPRKPREIETVSLIDPNMHRDTHEARRYIHTVNVLVGRE